MNDTKRFSGTLSIINRLQQNIAAVKFWAYPALLGTKVIFILSAIWYIFISGKPGWSLDYVRYYLLKLLAYIQEKYPDGGEQMAAVYGWLERYIRPEAFLVNYANGDAEAVKEALWIVTTTNNIWLSGKVCTILIFVIFFTGWVLARREYKLQMGDKFKRGSLLMTAKQLSKALKKFYGKGVIWIGNVLIPAPIENLSVILVGKPQQGKTIVINKFLSTTMKRGDRSVILVAKPGDFISTHFRAMLDQIFTPGHKESLRWSIANDIISMADFDMIANNLCPDKDEKNAIWSKGGREIIVGLFKYWWLSTKRKNSELWDIFGKTTAEWFVMLSQTPGCERAAGLISNPDSMPSFSFYITVSVAVKPLEMLKMMDGDFSIIKWLKEGKGNIYLLSTPRIRIMLNPVFIMFLDIMGVNFLELGQDRKRRIWWFLDELPELGATIKERLSQLLNVGPSFGFGALLSTQSVSQCENVFGELGSKAIFNACNTIGIFCIKDDDNADGLAKTLGKQEKEQNRSNYSVSANENKDSTTAMSEEKEVQLVMADELKMLKPKELYVQVAGFGCAKTSVKYVEYPKIKEAWEADPRFNLEQMELEYQILLDKKNKVFSDTATALEIKAKEIEVQNSAQPKVEQKTNDLRWQLSQSITDNDDGMAMF